MNTHTNTMLIGTKIATRRTNDSYLWMCYNYNRREVPINLLQLQPPRPGKIPIAHSLTHSLTSRGSTRGRAAQSTRPWRRCHAQPCVAMGMRVAVDSVSEVVVVVVVFILSRSVVVVSVAGD